MSQTTPSSTQSSGEVVPPPLRAIVTYLADENDPRPIGVRIVEPPANSRQASRGNLYIIVEFAEAPFDWAALGEQVLSAIQRTYYTIKGNQSAVLLEAFREARRVVDGYKAAHPQTKWEASVGCAALLRRRLLVACDGAAFALVRQGNTIELVPGDPGVEQSLPASAREPEVLRWELEPGDAALIAGPGWGDRVPMRTLASTIAHISPENMEDAAVGLLEAGTGVRAPGLLLFFEESSSAPPPRPAFLSSASQQRVGAVGLPTSLGAAPPLVSAPSPTQAETAAGEVATRPVASSSATSSPTSTPGDAGQPGASAPGVSRTQQMLEGAKSGMASARDLAQAMLPDRVERNAASLMDDDAMSVAPIPLTEAAPAEPQHPVFTPPPPSSGSRARLFVGLALLLLIAVPIIVLAVYWQRGVSNRADAESLITLAQARVAAAQEALDRDDKAAARAGLSEAKEFLQSAEVRVGRTAAIDELTLAIDRILLEVAQVQPLYGLTSPLVAFPPGASASQVLVVDQNIFVLDPARRVVERYRLDPSLEFVPNQVGDVVLREGEVIDGVSVGPLLDMAWQAPIAGFQDRSALLVLDGKNHVFRFDPRVDGASKLDLAEQEKWQNVRQIEMYQGRLYAADVGQGQVLRYQPGQYSLPPTPWFAQPVDLSDMRNMRIDGEIWLLLANGQVLRYFQGAQVPFSLDSSVGLAQQVVDFVVGDATNPYIYLADRAGKRIWVFDKNGAYIQQFAAAEGDPLNNLSALFNEDVTDQTYLLTDASLYRHPLPIQ